jgi:hypothetical protein
MPILLKVSNSRKNDMQCLFNGLYYYNNNNNNNNNLAFCPKQVGVG